MKDYMVLDTNGGVAYFYKVENEKPVVFANWMVGSLGLIDCKDEDVINRKMNELEPVSEDMAYFLDFIQNNNAGHTPLDGTLENPYICTCDTDDEDECICN